MTNLIRPECLTTLADLLPNWFRRPHATELGHAFSDWHVNACGQGMNWKALTMTSVEGRTGFSHMTHEAAGMALAACLNACQAYALTLHNVSQPVLNVTAVTLADVSGKTFYGQADTMLEAVILAMEAAFRQPRTVKPEDLMPDAFRVVPSGARRMVTAGQFQRDVRRWTVATFGEGVANDRLERGRRFTEEALELAQATGVSRDDVQALLTRVYGRPVGEVGQEVGGTLVTLAALCAAMELDMDEAGRLELAANWQKKDKIRAKWLTKVKGSPLPDGAPEVQAPCPDVKPCASALLLDGAPVALLRWSYAPTPLPEEFWPSDGPAPLVMSRQGQDCGWLEYLNRNGERVGTSVYGFIQYLDRTELFTTPEAYALALQGRE